MAFSFRETEFSLFWKYLLFSPPTSWNGLLLLLEMAVSWESYMEILNNLIKENFTGRKRGFQNLYQNFICNGPTIC